MFPEFNENFVFTYEKDGHKNLQADQKLRCKVLKFSTDWTFEEMIIQISQLSRQIYKKLYFFVIEVDNFGFNEVRLETKSEKFKILEKFLLEFSSGCPIMLTLISKGENLTKFYHKDESFLELMEINLLGIELEDFDDFPTFFKFVNRKQINNLEEKVLEKMPEIEGSTLIIKLLRTMNLPEELFEKLISNCAAKGSKYDFCAALDICPENVQETLTTDIENYLTNVTDLDGYPSDTSESEMSSSEDDTSSESSFKSCSSETKTSVLFLAVINSNKDVLDFLITNCKHLIRQLPYYHQVKISTTAFIAEQFNVLCDLLYCDYPFPDNLKIELVNDDRIKKIIDDRNNLHLAIETDKLDVVKKFIKKNPKIKIGYNTQNDSAIYQAICSKKFNLLYYLKSYGYYAVEFNDFTDEISDENDKQKATEAASIQMRRNVRFALENEVSSVLVMETRSFIHNKKISLTTERDYRKKIRNWYNDIYNTRFGCELMDVAAQCESLKIIFDFEEETVYNIDLQSKSSLGVIYPASKWIFIGAITSRTSSREQEIKGVIIHEICHYAMRLVYQNNDNPYYKGDIEKSKQFSDIVAAYNKWKNDDNEKKVNDECNGRISTVYTLYDIKDHPAELIVRAPQIQAEFDNNKAHEEHLEELYKQLFDFFENLVIPDLESFNLKKREIVQQLNKNLGFIEDIKNLDYKFFELKDLNLTTENHCTIVTTNTPQLLFANVHQYILEKDWKLLESRNVFISLNFYKANILQDYKQILEQNSNLNVFVDCTKEYIVNLEEIVVNKINKFIFFLKNDEGYEKLSKYISLNNLVYSKVAINYSWADLTAETQQQLLQTKINFQENSSVCLNELISTSDFSQVIDDQHLNLLLEKSEISINNKFAIFEDNFKALITPRIFTKIQIIAGSEHKINTEATKRSELQQQELIDDIKSTKFILISDNAGAGKSWIIKNIANCLREIEPNKWISYVDLKQFLNEFKSYKNVPDLESFMIRNVLKSLNQFEIKMFSHLYKNDNVSILLDGFDEIAPDFATFVLNLILSSESHKGNQVWITTRDYFEVDLVQKLKVDVIYKLKPLTLQESIDMIAARWVLNESKSDTKEFNPEQLKNLPNFKKYQKLAEKFIKRIHGMRNRSIGSPQFFKMVADVYDTNKDAVFDITNLKIYGEFVDMQYIRWSSDKGDLRKAANVSSQRNTLNYFGLHQYFALKSYFPSKTSFCDLECDDEEWPEEEIIACSFLIKIGDSFLFSHETFREYFAADFLIGVLKRKNSKFITEEFCRIFIHFLTGRQFQVIRMFLNEALEDCSISANISKTMPKIAEIFFKNVEKLQNLAELFKEDCAYLAIFFIKLLKYGRFDDVQKIFLDNKEIIHSIIIQPSLFKELQDFMINHLDKSNNKQFILKHHIVHKIFGSELDLTILGDFLIQLNQKLDNVELKEIVNSVDEERRSLFFYVTDSRQNFTEKFDILLHFLKKVVSEKEIIELVQQRNKNDENIMHMCMKTEDKNKMEYLWQTIESLFESQNSMQQFRCLFNQLSLSDIYIPLHDVAYCKNFMFHETMLNLLTKTFKNREELVKLLSVKTQKSNNFIHLVVIYNITDVIEITIKKLKEVLSESDYQKILRSKGQFGRNLLQLAACNSKDVKTHQILWKELRDSCKSNEEFLEILGQLDDNDDNVISLAAVFTTSEILEFMEKELENVASRDEINKLLINVDKLKLNVLQLAANFNKSLDLHKTLWKIIQKYFNLSEILEFIKHFDIYGESLLTLLPERNTREIINFTFEEVKKVLNIIDFEAKDHETHENVKLFEKLFENVLKSTDLKTEEKELLKLKWIKNENLNNSKLFLQEDQILLGKNFNVKNINDLEKLMADENIKSHEILWKHLTKTSKSKTKLNDLLTKKNQNGDNFIHLLVICNTVDVIEFTLKKFKENLSESDYQEILRSKGQFGRNLLQLAAVQSQEVKIYQILWNEIRDSCKSDEEFLEKLQVVDDNGDNVFDLTATFEPGKILKFMQKELEKFAPHEEIKKLLVNLGFRNRNLLQAAARQNKYIALHEVLWDIIESYFNSCEILQFLKHHDVFGWNVVLNVIEGNTKEVKELTCNKVRKLLIIIGYENNANFQICEEIMKKDKNFGELTKDEKGILKLDWIDSTNSAKLFEDSIQLLMKKEISGISLKDLMLFIADKNLKNHTCLWKYLEENLKIEKLKKILFENEKYDHNYIHFLVIYNIADVIVFTINKFKENLIVSDYQKIMKTKGEFGRNLLQVAACSSKDVKTHQILWKLLRDSCKSDEEFLELFREVDEFGSNVFNLATSFTTSKVFELMEKELAKIATRDQIKLFFISLGRGSRNLLQTASQNKSLEFHKTLWKILRKYFSSSELLEFIIHLGEHNVFKLVIKNNVDEVLQFTWKEVKGILSELYTDTETILKIEQCENIIQKINESEIKNCTAEEKEILNMKWIKSSDLFDDLTQKILKHKITVRTLNDLNPVLSNKNVWNHEIVWEHLLNTFENRQDLVKLLLEKDQDGDNFIHRLVIFNIADVIEFTLQKLKEILSDSDYQKILRSKGQFGRNLLQLAACNSKDVKTHQILWNLFRDSCKSNEEFLEILTEDDDKGSNIFIIVTGFRERNVIDFIFKELKKIASNEEIKAFLKHSEYGKRNLLQIAASQNKSLELHVTLWRLILKYFNPSEILEFIYNHSLDDFHLLHNVIYRNSKEIIEFTWTQIQIFITTKEDQIKYLKKLVKYGENILELALENETKDTKIVDWVEELLQKYEIDF